ERGILRQELPEAVEACVRSQGSARLQFAVVPYFVPDQRSRLGSTLQRTGDDRVHLHIHGCQNAAHFGALLDTLRIERPFVVLQGICFVLSSTGVSEEIEDHSSQLAATISGCRRERRRAGRGRLRLSGSGMFLASSLPSATPIRNACALNSGFPFRGGRTYWPSRSRIRAFAVSARYACKIS